MRRALDSLYALTTLLAACCFVAVALLVLYQLVTARATRALDVAGAPARHGEVD